MKKLLKNAKICKDCGREIDNCKIKGMKCSSCGKDICFRCNLGYKCKDCYIDIREDYYEEDMIEVMSNG